MSSPSPERSEWLEADGLGGFASGTAAGLRTRRYHALLLPATTPPTGRVVLVNGVEAWIDRPTGPVALSSQRYAPDVVHPDGASRIERFEADPWPRWRHRVDETTAVEHEIFVHQGVTWLVWRLDPLRPGVRLRVRLLFSGRDYHALHHENGAFRFEPSRRGEALVWRPYEGLPPVVVTTNGHYEHAPEWYRRFLYREEQERGLDCVEDLASPGELHFDLGEGEALLALAVDDRPVPRFERAREDERRRRRAFATRVDRSADAYLVRRGEGMTILAGYPWFTDWGRDTFIAMRGLCLATGRLTEAEAILLEWAGAVSEGMLPNRFADHGETPEFNAVDASLWYVIAVHDFFEAARRRGRSVSAAVRALLSQAVLAILEGYARGTRYRIGMDGDGLLRAGEPGVQLTWMDAKVGDWVVTPRIGKPVEVQALWLNALRIGASIDSRYGEPLGRGLESFRRAFRPGPSGGLPDVIDADHEPGKVDLSFRPNQLFAVGGLPFPLLEGESARAVVDAVEERLWTPLGPRSLAPGEPGYRGRYEGGVLERDGAYHQGTVWPWLAGPFVEAWVRVRGGSAQARREARQRFLEPLLARLDGAGLGHLPEIADADPPHAPRGCPFQAWSLAEVIRLDRNVL